MKNLCRSSNIFVNNTIDCLKFAFVSVVFFFFYPAFAERNTNASEACAQFKLAAAQSPTEEVTFKYYSGVPPIYRTYYKEKNTSNYYNSPEDRNINRMRMTARGDISVHPLSTITAEEYDEFFAKCGLFADKELLEFGFILVESANSDTIVAAKALEDSQWFETAYPMFITHFKGEE